MATRASSQKPGLNHKSEENYGTVKQNQKLCSGAATQHQTGLKLMELPAEDDDAVRVHSNETLKRLKRISCQARNTPEEDSSNEEGGGSFT